jgi:hypothetical protein
MGNMAKKQNKTENEREVVFESATVIECKEHLWQYDDNGREMVGTLRDMVGTLCPACQLNVLAFLCSSVIFEIEDAERDKFHEILVTQIKNGRIGLEAMHRPN